MYNIIHQVAFSEENLNKYISPNYANIKEFMGNYEYRFWDLPKFIELLKNDKATDVLEAINKIKPYAYKADLARYYIVHRFGGWYVDLNTYFQHAPPTNEYEMVVFSQTQFFTSESSWAVYNGLFYFNKEHRILRYMIDRCIENIKQEYYGSNPWCTTGPNLFGLSVAHFNLPENNHYLFGKALWNLPTRPDGFYFESTEPFAKYKPKGQVTGDSGLLKGNNYVEMWNNKEVY